MRNRIVVVIGAVILLPTAFALWMGWRSVRDERGRAPAAVSPARGARRKDRPAKIQNSGNPIEARLLDDLDSLGEDPDALREFSESDGLARQAFLVVEGEIVFPPVAGASVAEADFRVRAAAAFAGGALDRPVGSEGSMSSPDSGWVTWFHGEGQQFAYWMRKRSGAIVGAELNAAAFLSVVSGGLPEALGNAAPQDKAASRPARHGKERIVLVNAEGGDFLRWGDYEPAGDEEPLSARRLSVPFQGWEFRSYADSLALGSMAAGESWFLAVSAALLAAIIGAAVYYLSRGLRREMAEARQRVSFVNQVSHELKAPLTNIRLYADLLREGDCDDPSSYLEVISAECERLSRLIHNVLSFARRDEGEKRRGEEADWDAVVGASLECFKPAFAEKGIELEFRPGGSGRYLIDPDAIGQIIGNLVSNAEKYASSGRYVLVETGAGERGPWARVRDRGEGVPEKDRERIFEPFTRLSDSVSEGASGSGLGLSISRDLARQRGGDLVLEGPGAPGGGAENKGASFLLTVAAERID